MTIVRLSLIAICLAILQSSIVFAANWQACMPEYATKLENDMASVFIDKDTIFKDTDNSISFWVMYDIEKPTGRLKRLVQNEAIIFNRRLVRIIYAMSYDHNHNKINSGMADSVWTPIQPDTWDEMKLQCLKKMTVSIGVEANQ